MRISTLAISLGVALAAAPALAQKSADTLRLALNAPFNMLSLYTLQMQGGNAYYGDVYDGLLSYDEHKQKFVPMLAKSWKRVDDRTYEFELRTDIKFHNGDPMDANDAKATYDYLMDRSSKVSYRHHYSWIKQVEVLGPHKIRLVSEKPRATDLATLTYRFQVWNGKVLNGMSDRNDYGRLNPIGTGPYKVTQVDINKGVILERYDGYNTAPEYEKADIKRIHAIPVFDPQTRIGHLSVGSIDVLSGVSPDSAKELAKNPQLTITYVDQPTLFYLGLDSVGRSGNKALSDQRVRRAIFMAIDREAIIKHIVPGGEIAERIQAECFRTTIACKHAVQPPKYDPQGAKKLLAEAGYPDGFDLVYHSFTSGRPIAEAIAGFLTQVGVRTSVQPLVSIGQFRDMVVKGTMQAWSTVFPTTGFPDAGFILDVLYSDPAMQYFNDPILQEALSKGETELDEAKRADIYAKAFDRINEMHYHLPITSVPAVFAHSKDVVVKPNRLSAGAVNIADFAFK